MIGVIDTALQLGYFSVRPKRASLSSIPTTMSLRHHKGSKGIWLQRKGEVGGRDESNFQIFCGKK
jgi:hypothetical protein